MVTKDDILLLLTNLESKELNVDDQIMKLMSSNSIPMDVIKFINDHRQFDVACFYEMLRKNYNHKKSPLYKNLVKEEFENSDEIIVTLSALNLQIALFAKNLEDNRIFLKHSRAQEITDVLSAYYANYDLMPCLKALKAVKADIVVFETTAGRRSK